ncbi:hypothetical protein ACNPPY_13190 [Achromobacter sp. AGC78]
MLNKSYFTPETVFEKEIDLGDGKLQKLHFRKYSGAAFSAYGHAIQSTDSVVHGKANAILIADCLCDEEGNRELTLSQACALNPLPMKALFVAVLEVNGFTVDKKPTEEEEEQADPGNT